MKRKRKRHKKRKSRQRIGTENELKKQRDNSHHGLEAIQAQRQKHTNQNSSIQDADRENVLHWKLAKDYFKTWSKMAKTKNRNKVTNLENSMDHLFEKYR